MRRLMVAALGLLAPAAAMAQTGPYVAGEVGGSRLLPMLSDKGTTQIGTGLGPVGLGALGWGFGNGWRAEVEGSYRSGGIGSITTLRENGALLPLTGTSGSVSTEAVMINVDYDIPVVGLGLPVEPYVGAGVGYGRVDVSGGGNGLGIFALPNNNKFIGPDLVTFGSAGAFAYQAIGGLSMPLGAVPGLSAVLEYRYFGTARADVPADRVSTSGDVINGIVPSSALHNGFEVHDNTILLGVRYSFGGG